MALQGLGVLSLGKGWGLQKGLRDQVGWLRGQEEKNLFSHSGFVGLD